jgi:hypothetical protein
VGQLRFSWGRHLVVQHRKFDLPSIPALLPMVQSVLTQLACSFFQAGKEIKNSHKTIAKKAQKVVDSCKDEGTDPWGNKALSGILEVNGIWKVMLMRDSKLC